MTKQEIRKEMLLKLKALSVTQKQIWDKEIYYKFLSSNYFKRHEVFAIYWATSYEVATYELIITLLNANKKVCLPKLVGSNMEFYYINFASLNSLIKNKYNIYEPSNQEFKVNIADIEIIIVPLIAYNSQNHRIGHGKGYYDRFLSVNSIKASTIGLAYKMQQVSVNSFIADKWDITVNNIINNH